jgi:hypothetical protein
MLNLLLCMLMYSSLYLPVRNLLGARSFSKLEEADCTDKYGNNNQIVYEPPSTYRHAVCKRDDFF